MHNNKILIFLAILCAAILLFGTCLMALQEKKLRQQCSMLETEIMLLQFENAQLLDLLSELRGERKELGRRMERWLDEWDVDVWESTAYAPLDPKAKEGMCYSGDPSITASGARVVSGTTAAAGPDVPYGTLVRIRGAGWRRITDRGGRIGNRCIDLAVQTREEALTWGRRQVKVVYRKWARS